VNGQATRVFLLRHGETAWNVDSRIQGQLDIPLNATGVWQAEQLGKSLAGEGIEAIYSSDLSRAFVTASAVSRQTGVAVVTDVGLRERGFGHFEGATFKEIEERWPEDARRWRQRDPEFGPTGGENLIVFFDRCLEAATRLASLHPGGVIALVAHGGVLDCLYRAATRQALAAPRTWQLGNAAVNRLLFSDGGFSLVGWNDGAHLERAADVP